MKFAINVDDLCDNSLISLRSIAIEKLIGHLSESDSANFYSG